MNRLTAGLLQLAITCVLICHCVAPPPNGGGGGNGKRNDDRDGGPPGKGRGEGKGNGPLGIGNGPGRGWRGNQRHLDDDALNTLQNTWKNCRGKGKCKDNSDRQKKNRNAVKDSLKRDRGQGKIKGLDDATIERRFQKTFQAKKALLQLNGLADVDPHDNGLFGGDMLLNESDLDRIISRTQGVEDTAEQASVPLVDVDQVAFNPLTGTGARRKRGDMLALDYYGGNKWPTTTINFYIDPSDFKSSEASSIRSALQSISSVSCIKFVEGWKYPLMEFVKTPSDTDAGTCGWADVGYQGNYNSVNINFASSICKSTIIGVIIHEVLHSLGFVHEHTRYDRDRYLKIDWKNVDPQAMDVFNKDDPHDHNPYCAPFDPLSIMIYDAYVGALDSSKPAMSTVSYPDYYKPRMGMGTKMAASDASLLNKMYCKSSTCKDKSTNCGWTACTDCTTYGSVCPKSCGKC